MVTFYPNHESHWSNTLGNIVGCTRHNVVTNTISDRSMSLPTIRYTLGMEVALFIAMAIFKLLATHIKIVNRFDGKLLNHFC